MYLKAKLFVVIMCLGICCYSSTVPACRYNPSGSDMRVYYMRTNSTSPETYNAAYWTQYNAKTSCPPGNTTIQFVLTSEVTPRSGSCRVSYAGNMVTGATVTFDNAKIYTCPIDNQLLSLMLITGSIGFFYIRKLKHNVAF